MILGAKHVESPFIEFGQISTVLYFSHFLIIVPVISLLENSLIELNLTPKKKSIQNRNKPYKVLESSFSKITIVITIFITDTGNYIINVMDPTLILDSFKSIIPEINIPYNNSKYLYPRTINNDNVNIINLYDNISYNLDCNTHFQQFKLGIYNNMEHSILSDLFSVFQSNFPSFMGVVGITLYSVLPYFNRLFNNSMNYFHDIIVNMAHPGDNTSNTTSSNLINTRIQNYNNNYASIEAQIERARSE